MLAGFSIQSWHLFRKLKSERVYKILREYWLRRIMIIMILKIVLGKKKEENIQRTFEERDRRLWIFDYGSMVYDIWFHPASYHEVRSIKNKT